MIDLPVKNPIRRLSSVEWLRFIAAFGIVWFHAEGAVWRSVGYAGLPVFLLIFSALIVAHYSEISFNQFLGRRTQRLLIPWLFWSFVYAVLKMAKHYVGHEEPFATLEFSSFLVGGNIHLWYLPFAFLASFLLYFACKYLLRFRVGCVFLLLMVIAMVSMLVLSSWAMNELSFKAPFMQWIFALPSLPIGFCLGIIIRVVPSGRQVLWLAVVLLVVLMTFLLLLLFGCAKLCIPYSIGLSLTIAALHIRFPFESAAFKAGQLTYGIYLIHPLVGYIIKKTISVEHLAVSILLTFVVSAGLVYVLRCTFLRRFV